MSITVGKLVFQENENLALRVIDRKQGRPRLQWASELQKDVEEDVRRVLGENSAVWAVEGVTVNYRDTMLVEVDTTIRVDPESTVARTTQLAAGLKLDLESEDIIDKASIYLDLNEKTALFP